MATYEVNKFSEMLQVLQSDLTVGTDSTLFDPETGKLALARAYRKIGMMYKWPGRRDSQKTSSLAAQEYYDYPPLWQPDSMWKMRLDGVDFGDPLDFKDYLYEQENNYPSGLKQLWANENKRFFITNNALPPQATGNNNIVMWGFKVVNSLSNDNDVTIFSYHTPELNEAIILEATAILKQKGEIMQVLRRLYVSGSELLSYQATSIVNQAWNRVKEDNAKQEKTMPMFQVPDLFPTGRSRNLIKWNIGNFNNND